MAAKRLTPERLQCIRDSVRLVAFSGECDDGPKELIATLQDTCGFLLSHVDAVEAELKQTECLYQSEGLVAARTEAEIAQARYEAVEAERDRLREALDRELHCLGLSGCWSSSSYQRLYRALHPETQEAEDA